MEQFEKFLFKLLPWVFLGWVLVSHNAQTDARFEKLITVYNDSIVEAREMRRTLSRGLLVPPTLEEIGQ